MESVDPLTGLPNRQAFLDRLDHVIDNNPSLQNLTAIIIIKLKQLKQLNNEIGYKNTDDLLLQTAESMRNCLREEDFLARVSGSEFAVILHGLKSSAQPMLAAYKIHGTLSSAIKIDGKDFKPGLAIGISICPLDAGMPEELFHCADLSLAHALEHSKQISCYSDCYEEVPSPMIRMQRDLDTAIRDGKLSAVYQPVIDLDSGDLKSVELLSKWYSDAHGEVKADKFIPLAERTNLIGPLTNWNINNGFREFSQLESFSNGITLAVNLSPQFLMDAELPKLLKNASGLWNLPLERVTVEVTETAMMGNPEKCLEVLTELNESGISIAIDDFGTGYSSLEYLKRLPASVLKIDKSFVTNMLSDTSDRRLVQTMIDLAVNMDMTVVAEGIEDEETLDTLTLMGCHRAQGYFISRPLPAAELEAWTINYNDNKI